MLFEIFTLIIFIVYLIIGVIVAYIAGTMLGPQKDIKGYAFMLMLVFFWPAIMIFALLDRFRR